MVWVANIPVNVAKTFGNFLGYFFKPQFLSKNVCQNGLLLIPTSGHTGNDKKTH